MTLPAALLLDLDGTLVDSEPIHRAAYAGCFAARGWHDVDLGLFTDRRAADVFVSTPGPWSTVGDPVALAREVESYVAPDARPTPVPGAAALVRVAAAAGVPVAIVTSAHAPWVAVSVGEVLGVLHLVSTVVTADDVTRGKPHPAGFALACARLSVDPALTAALEDSPAGLAAARAAGVGHLLGVSTTWPAAELRAAGADVVVPDLVGCWDEASARQQ